MWVMCWMVCWGDIGVAFPPRTKPTMKPTAIDPIHFGEQLQSDLNAVADSIEPTTLRVQHKETPRALYASAKFKPKFVMKYAPLLHPQPARPCMYA